MEKGDEECCVDVELQFVTFEEWFHLIKSFDLLVKLLASSLEVQGYIGDF